MENNNTKTCKTFCKEFQELCEKYGMLWMAIAVWRNTLEADKKKCKCWNEICQVYEWYGLATNSFKHEELDMWEVAALLWQYLDQEKRVEQYLGAKIMKAAINWAHENEGNTLEEKENIFCKLAAWGWRKVHKAIIYREGDAIGNLLRGIIEIHRKKKS